MKLYLHVKSNIIDLWNSVSGNVGSNVTNWSNVANYDYIKLNTAQQERFTLNPSDIKYIITGETTPPTLEQLKQVKSNELTTAFNAIVASGFSYEVENEVTIVLACQENDIQSFSNDLNGLNNLISLDKAPENITFLNINGVPNQLATNEYRAMLGYYYTFNRNLKFWVATKQGQINLAISQEELDAIVLNDFN
jgi:hypothetical protein